MMEIRRVGPIGAEITDVDVKSMDDTTFGRIYQAWLDCNVICVRDQSFGIDDFLARCDDDLAAAGHGIARIDGKI